MENEVLTVLDSVVHVEAPDRTDDIHRTPVGVLLCWNELDRDGYAALVGSSLVLRFALGPADPGALVGALEGILVALLERGVPGCGSALPGGIVVDRAYPEGSIVVSSASTPLL